MKYYFFWYFLYTIVRKFKNSNIGTVNVIQKKFSLHEFFIAKMDAYGFSENALIFFFSYLKRQKQSL